MVIQNKTILKVRAAVLAASTLLSGTSALAAHNAPVTYSSSEAWVCSPQSTDLDLNYIAQLTRRFKIEENKAHDQWELGEVSGAESFQSITGRIINLTAKNLLVDPLTKVRRRTSQIVQNLEIPIQVDSSVSFGQAEDAARVSFGADVSRGVAGVHLSGPVQAKLEYSASAATVSFRIERQLSESATINLQSLSSNFDSNQTIGVAINW